MSNVKIYHDGWIALPATLRQQLGLRIGDELIVERVEGGILLRAARGAKAPIERAELVPTTPAAVVEAEPVRRKVGRPKRAAVPAKPARVALRPPLRSGGRRKAKGIETVQSDGPLLVTLA